MLARQPTKVEGVDRNAVPAEPGPWIEGRKAEGLGFRRVDDFPYVDSHAIAEHLELVHKSDVHGAVGVFQNLAGLGYLA